MKKIIFAFALLCLGSLSFLYPNENDKLAKAFHKAWVYNEIGNTMNTMYSEFYEIGSRCVSLNWYSISDIYKENKDKSLLEWYFEIEDKKFNAKDTEKIKRINMLVTVGFLKKKKRTLKDGKKIIRYSLTQKGIKSMLARTYQEKCFFYGVVDLVDIDKKSIKPIKNMSSQILYSIKGKEKLVKIEKWAKRADVQALFPQIAHHLSGKEKTYHFIKKDGKFVPERKDLRQLQKYPLEKTRFNPDFKIENSSSIATTTKEKLRKYLISNANGNGAWACLELPGRSKTPVDKIIQGSPYSVLMYKNIKRDRHEREYKNTIEYLNDLVKSKVFTAQEIQQDGKKAIKYTITDKYAKHLHSRYNGCLNIGFDDKFKFISYKIRKTSIKNCYITHFVAQAFTTKPQWVNDEMLKEWKLLNDVFEKGKLYYGDTGIGDNPDCTGAGYSITYAFPNYTDGSF